LEDQCAVPLREKRGDPVNNVGRDVSSQEGGPKGAGVDVVKTCRDVEEECGDPEFGPLEGPALVSERQAGIKGAEAGEGTALVGVRRPLVRARQDSLTVMTSYGILYIVWRRTMMRKEARES